MAMLSETNGPTTIITQDAGDTFASFVEQLTAGYDDFQNQHIIVDLSDGQELAIAELKAFLPFSKSHRKAKKSFVVVVPELDFNKTPAQLHVVPTRQEAYDLIEMEEIERDLGF